MRLLRMNFITKQAIRTTIDLYKTDNQRDWSYIIRRECRYNILLNSFFKSFVIINLFQCLAIYRAKKMVFLPLVFWPAIGMVLTPKAYRANSRRCIEMLNIDTEFEIGVERNRDLKECNGLAHRADF